MKNHYHNHTFCTYHGFDIFSQRTHVHEDTRARHVRDAIHVFANGVAFPLIRVAVTCQDMKEGIVREGMFSTR